MLYEYVDTLGKNFGKFRLIYSVHNLIHLPAECLKQNQPLDAFSMWEFETANSSLKEFTKRQGAYLEQTYNRTMEKYHSRFDFNVETNKFPMLKMETDHEYDDDCNITKTFFYRIEYKKFMLDASDGNRWFLTKSGEVGQYDKTILVDDKIKIRCRIYKKKFDYFSSPLNSSFLNIYHCYKEDLSNYLEITADLVVAKMFKIIDGSSSVFIPLL